MGTYVVHSFVEKIMRAEKHIDDLKVEIAEYAARHPYTVRTGFESKKRPKVSRLHFIEYPGTTDIPLIAADAIYNLRSALDHLMAALVPKSRRRSVYFPIFFKGVWESKIPGESQQRTKDRGSWCSHTKGVKPGALAVLKELQPRDGARDHDPFVNFLVALNRVAVKDRHVKLPFIAPTLRDYRVTCTRADGAKKIGWTDSRPNTSVKDGAILNGIPEEAVDIKIEGTPAVLLDIGGTVGHLKIPERLEEGARKCQELIVAPLLPYLADDML